MEEPMELDLNSNLESLKVTFRNDRFNASSPDGSQSFRGRGGRRGRGNRGRGSRGGGHGDERDREDNNNASFGSQESPSFGHRGKGRGRGRGRGSMNMLPPRKSANDRLLRSPLAPEKKQEVDEPLLSNDSKVDRTFQREVEVGGPGCICLRNLQKVFCEACGFCTEGRLSKPCPIHPRDSYLLDISSCPRKTCGLKHFEGMPRPRLVEFPLPRGYPLKIVNRKLT